MQKNNQIHERVLQTKQIIMESTTWGQWKWTSSDSNKQWQNWKQRHLATSRMKNTWCGHICTQKYKQSYKINNVKRNCKNISPMMTKTYVTKYLRTLEETAHGHLDEKNNCTQSTKPTKGGIKPTTTNETTNYVYDAIFQTCNKKGINSTVKYPQI